MNSDAQFREADCRLRPPNNGNERGWSDDAAHPSGSDQVTDATSSDSPGGTAAADASDAVSSDSTDAAPCTHCDDGDLHLLMHYFREWDDDDEAALVQATDLLHFLADNGARIVPVSHPQCVVQVDEWSARVDIQLAPLIQALWRAGIPTAASCQGGAEHGPAYISFPARPEGQVSFAHLLHADLSPSVDSLTADPDDLHNPCLRWDTEDMLAMRVAVNNLAWPGELAWNTCLPTVIDLYDWR